MSDPVTSGEPTVAPASTSPATPAPADSAAASAAPAFAFGTTRGSGLARGKRGMSSAPATAAASAPATGEYKPTAIQVVTTEREYKNPFAPEGPAPAVPVAQPTPSVPPEVSSLPVSIVTPVKESSSVIPPAEDTPSAKAELNILPPEPQVRPSQSWESGSNAAPAPEKRQSFRREDRGTFRPEKREGAGEFRRENREPRDNREAREPREPRDNRDNREGRPPREHRENREGRPFEARPPVPAPPAPKKTGFIAWLKGLFGSKPAAPAPAPEPTRGEGREDFGHRRHHRGGRGRHQGYRGENQGGENRGPREGSEPRNDSSGQFQGERNFDGGHRRRRHRGGRGRGQFRGDNRGGESRGDHNGGSAAS